MKKYIHPSIKVLDIDKLCCNTGSHRWGSHSHHHHHKCEDTEEDDEEDYSSNLWEQQG